MKHLILIRHGQSEWNQQKRFTGWVDVGLTDKGRAEAKKAGELIKGKKIKLDSFYSSFQKRANDTLKIIMKELDEDENLITRKWQLNERHYGELTGLNKEDMKNELVRNILSINGVEGIFLGQDFISVNKNENIKWDEIKHIVISLINDFYADGKEFVIDENLKEEDLDLSEIESKIVKILEEKIKFCCLKDLKINSLR